MLVGEIFLCMANLNFTTYKHQIKLKTLKTLHDEHAKRQSQSKRSLMDYSHKMDFKMLAWDVAKELEIFFVMAWKNWNLWSRKQLTCFLIHNLQASSLASRRIYGRVLACREDFTLRAFPMCCLKFKPNFSFRNCFFHFA